MKELIIIEEKYLNDNKNNYFINYEIKKLPIFSNYQRDNYIPSSKIYFELEFNQNSCEPIIYCQKSSLNKDELNYVIHYTNKTKKANDNISEINPALFIFLIDQSGSMFGKSINIASKGLKLFLQSLPDSSYYQIIGFGSQYIAYDTTPKEYTQENIKKSLQIIEHLDANLGGTDIYTPLKYVFDSYKIHETIKLPRNIFLLTDGEICDKSNTLDLIDKNSSKYSIYSIGIGNYFDEDLIKNAGIIGKGGYNFCRDIEGINKIIVKEINRAISPFCSNINIKTSLDNENFVKNQSIPNILRDNEIINLNYIINSKENNNSKINVEINYLENEEKIEKKYEIIPYYLPEGEELSKLIINNYLKNNNLIEEEIKLRLKYQIFGKNTSLFTEIELSDKVTGEMKEKILQNQKNNHTMNYMDNSKGMGMNMNMGMMGIGMGIGNMGIGMNMGSMGNGMNLGNMVIHAPYPFIGGYAPPPNWNMGMMNQQMNMIMMNSSPPMNMGIISSPPNKSICMSNNNNLNNASITPNLSNDDYKMKDIQEKKIEIKKMI